VLSSAAQRERGVACSPSGGRRVHPRHRLFVRYTPTRHHGMVAV